MFVLPDKIFMIDLQIGNVLKKREHTFLSG